MSHTAIIEARLKDLAAIKAACLELGIEFLENKKTHVFWAGATEPCEHAIRIPGDRHEIGLVKSKAGDWLEISADMYNQHNAVRILGQKAEKLMQTYNVIKTETEMRRKGYTVRRELSQNGAVNVRVSSARW